jgi:hypothetical protein
MKISGGTGGSIRILVKIMRLQGKDKDCNAHYLVVYEILQRPTHILSSENALVLLILLPAKQKQNAGISFHHHP